jgi:hypothetical protein
VSNRRFVIVPHRPRARTLLIVLGVSWLVSLALVYDLTRRYSVPDLARTERELQDARDQATELQSRIDRLRQRNAVARRSDEVSRAANQALQETLSQRDQEIAALRADTAFYERYTLTLTQNLKKASVSKGDMTLRVDGVRDGKLSSLAWSELLQQQDAAPQGFAFKYFQQLEGSMMLPAGFTPHRVRVQLRTDGRQSEQVFPWQAKQA